MTTEEFSNGFDTLLNSYNIKPPFGNSELYLSVTLDEYEKSLFLTESLNQIVVELYSGRSNKEGAFEATEELRSNLRSLIKTAHIDVSEKDLAGLSKYSKFVLLPEDLLFITYESATINDDKAECKNGTSISVIPVTLDELHKTIQNPFKLANERRILRLDNGANSVELISKYNINKYIIRYLAKPTPIVLADFAEMGKDVFPEVQGKRTECKLDSILHIPILERAVMLALYSKSAKNKGTN